MNFTKEELALLALQRFSWEQGMAVQWALETEHEDLLRALVKAAIYRSIPDGRPAQMSDGEGVTDACCMGEGLTWLAEHVPGEEGRIYRDAERRLLQWALQDAPRNQKGIVYHLADRKEFWIDSVYMLPPFLVAAGHPAEGVRQFEYLISVLYDPAAGLCRHICLEEETEDGNTVRSYPDASFWATGNGWALTAAARMIDLLPDSFHEEKERIAEFGRKLLNRVLSCQTSDGLFPNVLDDPSSFSEASVCVTAAYTIYRGCRSGWLEPSCLEKAEELRMISERNIDEDGFLQNVCGMPHFDHKGQSPEAQAFWLMMEHEAERMDQMDD